MPRKDGLLALLLEMGKDPEFTANCLGLARALASNVDTEDYGLFSQVDWPEFFCCQLGHDSAELVLEALLGIECLLTLEKQLGLRLTALRMQQAGHTRTLEGLQDHPNEQVYRQSFRLIERFFPHSEE